MNRIVRFALYAFVLMLASACVQKLAPVEDAGPHAVRMVLEGSVEPYEADNTKAASALSWKSGDVIYVRTETSVGVNTSYAQYGSDGAWTFNYTGALRTASAVQCCFFEKSKSTGVDQVTLSYTSTIYEDNAATLTVSDDGTVTLSTYLKPKTGRISFHGNSKAIKVSGLSWYSSFSLKDFTFTESVNANVKTFTASATNYFYGFFAEDNPERELYVTSEDIVYKRSFGENVLRSGSSGYVDVPTHDAYEGWTVTDEAALAKFQPIVIEDANFEAWLLARGYDTDGDGEISIAEAERVTEIVCEQNETVKSLKGIEHFPNLRTLRWTGGEYWDDERQGWVGTGLLTDVDVSQNAKLRVLDLSNNHLTSIDVSHNPNLETLQLRGNWLVSLDVSSNPSLRSLRTEYNLLTSLNVTGCSQLTELEACQNKLSSLDVSGLTELLFLDLNENFSITTLDVTGCPKLDALHVRGNKLSSLDLSRCPNITALNIGNNLFVSFDLSICPNLQWYSCHENQFTSLDLSPCPNLYHLNCGYCPGITSLDLSPLPNLQELFCEASGLTALDLSYNPKLRILNCSYIEMGYLPDLSDCREIRQLECRRMGLTQLDISNLSKLEWFYCSENDLSASGLDLSGNPLLRDLDCSNCNLTSLDLSSNLKLEWLPCYDNNLTELDVYVNSALNYLNVENNPNLETVIVKSGHFFANGIYYNGITTIEYVD